MAGNHDLGRNGEELAALALQAAGWRVLHRNYRLGHKEVDLIVRRGQTIAFIEVKTRTGKAFGHPLEAVTARKRREIETVASAWVARHGRPGLSYRFDAVAVTWNRSRPTIEHVENAWRMNG